MAIVITTYALAAGLMSAGMNWWQALLTISLGNLIVLIPMLLNAHAGTKYGVPFPCLRPRLLRGEGGELRGYGPRAGCLRLVRDTDLARRARPRRAHERLAGAVGLTCQGTTFIAFFVFWVIQLAIILAGIEGVKYFESFSAPLLIVGSIALLVWGFSAGGGVSERVRDLCEAPAGRRPVLGAVLAAVSLRTWGTGSRSPSTSPTSPATRRPSARKSSDRPLVFPLTMTAFSFIGIAVTAATIVVFDKAIWDPVVLVTRVTGSIPALLVIAMIIIVIAQISTNMAANVVSPSFDFSNLAPKYISFRTGGIITALIGILSFPWVLLESVGAYIFTWLVGYGSLLGAIGAVMIVDYWIVRKRHLNLADLYKHDGIYAYSGGWNWRAIVAVLVSVALVVPGFLKAADDRRASTAVPSPTRRS